MAETITPPTCLCGCGKSEHRQGRKSCLKCDCDTYEPAAEPEPPAVIEAELRVAEQAARANDAERELHAARELLANVKHAVGSDVEYPESRLPGIVASVVSAREGFRADAARLGEELAGALQRLAEYDSGASVDRLLHDADAIDLDRVRHAAAGTRTAASILRDVLATAARELELRAEADRLRAEAARVDDEIRRLVAGEPEPRQPTDAEVREWAQRAGRSVPADGRVAKVHVDAYKQAHGLVSL